MVPHFALKPQIQLRLSASKHNGLELLHASNAKSKAAGSINPAHRSENKQLHDRLLANRLRRIAASRPSGCFARAQRFESLSTARTSQRPNSLSRTGASAVRLAGGGLRKEKRKKSVRKTKSKSRNIHDIYT